MPCVLLLLLALAASAATLEVGPGKQYARPCDAIRAAAAGDTILIASGLWQGDVCTISRSGLTIRGVGASRPHLDAAGRSSEGKGIWVVSGAATGLTVEGIEFSGSTVPDRNGAGIRVDPGASVTIRDCYFHENETGVLTGNGGVVTIEYSTFDNNGFGDGQSHNVYVNYADRFVFRGNYSTRCRVGQLVKSRARETYILYNRLSQENGTGSREIDLSNGGRAFVIGNVIQQGEASQNRNLLGYQPEGPAAQVPVNELYVINNTFVNQASTGSFVMVNSTMTTPVVVRNNVFFGPGAAVNQPNAIASNNFAGNPGFTDLAFFELALRPGSPAIDAGADPGETGGVVLSPEQQYRHPACGEARTRRGVIDIGAFEDGGSTGAILGPARCAETRGMFQVVHGATFQRESLAPGAIATIFGQGLAPDPISASGSPLPTILGGLRLAVRGTPAPLFFAGPTQANFQIPYGIDPGSVMVEVRINDQQQPSVRIDIADAAPGVFLQPDRRQAAARNEDSSLNTPLRGAAPGSTIAVYFTGQGRLNGFLADGEPAPADRLFEAALPKSATIGGREAVIRFLGMTPGLVGVAQANLVVPEGLPPGNHTVSLRIGTGESNPAQITVSAP